MKQIIIVLSVLLNLRFGYCQELIPNDKMALLKGVVTNFKGKPLAKK